MRIAVSYDNGAVCGKFADSKAFKLYDTMGSEVVFTQDAIPTCTGVNALSGFLADQQVTCLICGEIGPDGETAMDDWGIQLYGGCSGSAEDRVRDLLDDKLTPTNKTVRGRHHL